ncbi:MAG: hypothetical protein PHP92_04935 [Candidatus Nanoarchaeia archaeon]|nr:hypothetical protein [Candidatus Nanoarchaeia archaeon]
MGLWDSSKNYILATGVEYNENLSSQVDGVAKLFTVSKGKYIAGKLRVFINGVKSCDFVETNPAMGAFTMNEAPVPDESGIKFYVEYNHV